MPRDRGACMQGPWSHAACRTSHGRSRKNGIPSAHRRTPGARGGQEGSAANSSAGSGSNAQNAMPCSAHGEAASLRMSSNTSKSAPA